MVKQLVVKKFCMVCSGFLLLRCCTNNAVARGANIVNPDGGTFEGNLLHPTLIYPVNETMRIYHEEQFGPIVPIVPYTNIELPLRYIQESRFGQQASIFGKDKRAISRFVTALSHQVSRININCKCQRTPDSFPFSGRKDSGEGVFSVREALDIFSEHTCIAARENIKR